MAYIYEMDVALLKMQYLLPFNFHIHQVTTCMANLKPYDRTNIQMYYKAEIQETYMRFPDGLIITNAIEEPMTGNIIKILKAESFEMLVEECRLWCLQFRDQQQSVNKMTNS